MSRRNIYDWIDPSKQANDHLNAILDKGMVVGKDGVITDEELLKEEEKTKKGEVVQTPETSEIVDENSIQVNEARLETPLLERVSDRQKTRILILTKDTSVIQKGSIAYRRIVDMRDMFLEIHILVLNLKEKKSREPAQRLFENVWLYQTNSSSWWRLSYDAYKNAESQLVFNAGFRADIIVAEDLFESGLAGWFLSQKYKRPLQLHVYEDFFDTEHINTQAYPSLYEWSVQYLLNRIKSVRTRTEFQRQAIIAKHLDLESTTELLPNYYNLEVWRDFVPTVNLHERYPQFKFNILHISSMSALSHTREVLFGTAKILRRYPTIGLIIVGNGPQRSQLERQTIALGIQKQVEFEPMTPEIISYMKSANIFIHLSEDGSEDELLLEAAVAKLPIIANSAGLAGKLFVDGESARLCTPQNAECIYESINMYLNENQLRTRFALNASDIVFERIEQNYGAYLRAYSQSIERCIAEVS